MIQNFKIFLFCFLVNFLFAPVVLAGNDSTHPKTIFDTIDWSVDVSFENLNYVLNRSNYSINDQETIDIDLKFIFDNKKNLKMDLEPRLRVDVLDSNRNRYIPNDFYIMNYGPHHEVYGGLILKTLGVSEFYSPTNVFSRRDFGSNTYFPDDLGEAILGFKWLQDAVGPFSDVTLELLTMPYFQEAPLPSNGSRFRIQGNLNGFPYDLSDSQERPSYWSSVGVGVIVAGTVSPFDLELVYYHGPDRSDLGLGFEIDGGGALRVKPYYYTIDMMGFNAAASVGNFVFHLELAYKMTGSNGFKAHAVPGSVDDIIPKSYFQFVPGVTYDVNDFLGKGTLSFLLEYYGEDKRDSNIESFRVSKNDMFFAVHWNLNNPLGTSIKAAVLKDLGNAELVAILDFETKIYKQLKMNLQGVYVRQDADKILPLSFFQNNSYVMTRLSYSFGGVVK